MGRLAAVIVVGLMLQACTPRLADLARYPDAPMQLRDDSDRVQATDALWVTPLGPARDAARAAIADAIVHRLDDALADDATARPIAAEALVFELAALWQDDPSAIGRGLAPHVELLHELRAMFAKTGALEPTIVTLAMLAEIEPSSRAARLAEIDEVLAFAPSPSAIADAVHALPLGWLVDRYAAVLEARQKSVSEQLAQGHALDLTSELHDVALTARRIAGAYARTGRLDQIAPHLATLEGLGEDGALRELAATAASPRATASTFVDLARALRSEDHDQVPDPAAALAVCRTALAKFGDDPHLLSAAAASASALGRVEQPIALYRAALAHGATDGITALRLGRLIAEHIGRLAFGSRPAAAHDAWLQLKRDAARESVNAPAAWAQVLALAESALGRGLLSQGRIHEAEDALVGSIDHAPSIDAYEALTVLYFKTSRLGPASHAASAGLKIANGSTTSDQYRRAKLERLAGDVMRTAGRSRDAAALYLDSVRTWAQLGDDRGLPRPIAAERKLEFARGMWYLGSSDKAVDLALEATELAPEVGTTTVDTVAFLLEVGKPEDAIDAAHRGIGSPELGELDKVYVSLWVLADEHRRGEPHDRQAWEFLASRHGDLWYELLAEAATGRLEWPALSAAATTAPRQAELAFYGASLQLDPGARDPAMARRLLERSVSGHLLLDAEYDLARQYLTMPP
ncbi:MAG TPA: hypothetical protein VH143_08475 [Kofleriaceae bacterium]|nr:hypothetical protein [Kofleriaceae bacterium]